MTDALQSSSPGIVDAWPPLKMALWRVLMAENLNDGHYIKAFELIEKLFAAASSEVGCGTPGCLDPHCEYGKGDDAAEAMARSSAGSAIALADELQQYIDNYPGGPPKHFLLKLHAALSAPAQPSAGRAHPADCACDRCQGRPLSRSRSPALAQPSAGIGEPVAWQFRQRSGVGKGPQSQAPWGDWCGIEREDYERYTREPNPLIQVRPLYTGVAQPSAGMATQQALELADAIAEQTYPQLYDILLSKPEREMIIAALRGGVAQREQQPIVTENELGLEIDHSAGRYQIARQILELFDVRRKAPSLSSTDREPPDYGYCLCGRHRDDQCDYCVSLSSPDRGSSEQ